MGRAVRRRRPRPRAEAGRTDRSRREGYARVTGACGPSGPARRRAEAPSFRAPDVAMTFGHAPGTQKPWRRPIFPKGCPLSIFGAGELNFRVRDGNGCGLSASVTRVSCVWTCLGSGSPSRSLATGRRSMIFFRFVSGRAWRDPDIPDLSLTLGQLLKRSSPRPLVRLSFIRHRTSTCRLSNRWSPCGLTRLTRWGTLSRGELRT